LPPFGRRGPVAGGPRQQPDPRWSGDPRWSSDPRYSPAPPPGPDQRWSPEPRWDQDASRDDEPRRGSRLPRPDDYGRRADGPRRGEPVDELPPITTRTMVRRKHMPLWQELPLLLVVAFCLAVLIRTFLLQAFFIPSASMEQTLLEGDRVLVNKMVYNFRDPQRGEVVVFRGPDNWVPEHAAPPDVGLLGGIGRTVGDLIGVSRPGEKDFIKRVIAVGGDRVRCCDEGGNVIVNGKSLNETYIYQNSQLMGDSANTCRAREFKEIVIPAGKLFVMGDHRLVSHDARCQGVIGVEDVIGRAFVIVWPNQRWASLSVPDTFKDVPDSGTVAAGRPAGTLPREVIGVGAVLPILASLAVSARSGGIRRWRRRRLPS
jgi:signal peptidase I